MPQNTPTRPPPAQPPIALPRLLMQRAVAVAAAVLLLALGLGLQRMHTDIDDEFEAARTLVRLVAQLGQLDALPDAAALAALRTLAADPPPRHLLLQVRAADGRLLLAPATLPPSPTPLRWLLALHRRLLAAPESRPVAWPLRRPDGTQWQVSLTASHESERREAMVNLLGTLALLLACIAGLLLAMRWNLRRALAPLGRLLAAISGIEGRNPQAVLALPAMPIHELALLAAALRHLASALDQTEERRRLLSQQLLSLQEDERARLARELHDEFGQRLTALRVDAAWLARRLAGQPEAAAVVAGMAGQCQWIQQDIRALLLRLLPFGPAEAGEGGDDAGQTLGRISALLHALVAGWTPAAASADHSATQYRLELQAADAQGQSRPWPAGAAADALVLPQALALTLYRISQEALTNVARHARAGQAVLRLRCQGDGPLRPGAPVQIDWSVTDDGIGLPGLPADLGAGLVADLAADLAADPRVAGPSDGPADARTDVSAACQRGNGISGLRERVWAQGSELRFEPGPGGRGLSLAARFNTVWQSRPALPADPPQPGAARPAAAAP